MVLNPKKPYNELPLLPPHADIESKEILRKATAARAALAELKGIAETIPQPEILINSILLQEAKDSSEIENIITTNDSLYKATILNDDRTDPATKEVIRYRQALWSGYNILKKKQFINTNVAIEIYQILKDTSAGIRKTPGTTLKNTTTGEIMYTPPEGEHLLRDKLDNLWYFINDGKYADVDPLIKMAAMHYQFESLIGIWIFRERGFVYNPFLYNRTSFHLFPAVAIFILNNIQM